MRNSIRSLSDAIQCEKAVGAEAIEKLIQNREEDVDPAEDIEDAINTWTSMTREGSPGPRGARELSPVWVPETNAHCFNFCTEPAARVALELHLQLIVEAIHASGLKRTTALVLTAVYTRPGWRRGGGGGYVPGSSTGSSVNYPRSDQRGMHS